jgi:hypothetical protein
MRTKFPIYETIILLIILIMAILSGCGRPGELTKTVTKEIVKYDTTYIIDASFSGEFGNSDTVSRIDTVRITQTILVDKQCPKAKKIKIKKSTVTGDVIAKDSSKITIQSGTKGTTTEAPAKQTSGVNPIWLILTGLIFLIIGFIIGRVTKK